MDVKPLVFVISGDSNVRRSLSLRLTQLGFACRLCHSTEDFQQKSSPHDAGCILLHVCHADVDLDWLNTLGPLDHHWPVIGVSATADMETAVLAMKRGAFDFLLKSCSDRQLKDAVVEAVRWDAVERKHIAHVQSLRRRLKKLTPPQREVLELLLKGKSNREIADELGMSVRSIEVRRAKVMETMRARSLAVLVRQTLLVHGVGPSRSLLAPAVDPFTIPAAPVSEFDLRPQFPK